MQYPYPGYDGDDDAPDDGGQSLLAFFVGMIAGAALALAGVLIYTHP